MAVIPSTPELKRMIEQAMKDRAPKMWRDLKAAGKLDAVIEERAEQARETHEMLASEAKFPLLRNPKPDWMEQVAALDGASRQAWEIAFAQAIEFPPEISPQP